jgi:hypothetical protein
MTEQHTTCQSVPSEQTQTQTAIITILTLTGVCPQIRYFKYTKTPQISLYSEKPPG